MIEDLLDMNRIASGKIRLDLQRVDLRTLVAAAEESMRPAAENKGVSLSTRITADPATVVGDSSRLQQILANLLTNAIKFTPGGGSIEIRLSQSDDLLHLAVIDSGVGIAPDLLPFVFDRFRQSDSSASRKHGGLGLGLAIVKQLAELHGGAIAVSSDGPGKGTAFTLSLPPAPLDDTEIGERPAALPAGALKGLRILVVDDEPDARTLTRRILQSAGATVITTGSVEDALWQLHSRPFDVLVSDIGMPGEDGYSLIRRVRATAPDHARAIPAVAVTAFARPEDRSKALDAGFHTHAPKPIEPAELIAVIANLVPTGAH